MKPTINGEKTRIFSEILSRNKWIFSDLIKIDLRGLLVVMSSQVGSARSSWFLVMKNKETGG